MIGVQTGSGALPPSYPLCTRTLTPVLKQLGRETDHSPPSCAEVEEYVELYLHCPNTPSWRGAQFKKNAGITDYCIELSRQGVKSIATP